MVNKITTPPTQNEVIDKINELVDDKQDTLVSGTNIKTVGGTSLLGSGNVAFPIVSLVSSSSTNADAVGAKLFYDTVGDIETVINTIRGV
jgi:hypothetical protein